MEQKAVVGSGVGGGVDEVVDAYRRYMEVERRLAPLTVVTSSGMIRRFLVWRAGSGELDLAGLGPAEVNGYIRAEAARLKIGSVRALVGALRPFLRYLFATGTTSRDLSGAVGSVAGSRFATLPKGLDAATVTVLLDSCDRDRPNGLRDRAILLLMVRLGLRAIEVTAMRLEDISWRSGELLVHGKGGRDERLPLPGDVGEAVVDYLCRGRQTSTSRAVFLQARPPAVGMSRNAVAFVSRTASSRAGIAVVGGHRLRHTAATDMLRAGASLRQVGQVLRHNDDTTTAIYAKVDRASLALVVRPWPGAAR